MELGRVVGQVVSTIKLDGMSGTKLLVITALDDPGSPSGDRPGATYVAVDRVGAGGGEVVLVTRGSGARIGAEAAEIDAAVVGIVDSVVMDGRLTFDKSTDTR